MRFFTNIDFSKQTLIHYLRFIVGIIFIYASFDKIINPLKFANAISSYDFSVLIGASFLDSFLALFLPWLELLLGLCMILGIYLDEANDMIIGLLVFFIVMLYQAYFRGISLSDCGCGLNESTIGMDIFRDFILIFICLLIKFRALILGRTYDR